MSDHDVPATSRLDTYYRAWRRITIAFALVSGAAVFALMFFIVADVLSRNVMGGSIPGSFEIAQNYFMPLAVFPALAYVYGTAILPRMDLLRDRLPERARAGIVHVLLALEVVLMLVLIYFTWVYAIDGWERGVAFPAGGSLYTVWPLYFVVPLAFAMVLIETVFVIARNITTASNALGMTTEETSA